MSPWTRYGTRFVPCLRWLFNPSFRPEGRIARRRQNPPRGSARYPAVDQAPLLGGIGERAAAIPEHLDRPPLGGQHQLGSGSASSGTNTAAVTIPTLANVAACAVSSLRPSGPQRSSHDGLGKLPGTPRPATNTSRSPSPSASATAIEPTSEWFAEGNSITSGSALPGRKICSDGTTGSGKSCVETAASSARLPEASTQPARPSESPSSWLSKAGSLSLARRPSAPAVGGDVALGAGAKEQFVRTITIPVEHHDAWAGLGQSPGEHWLALKIVERRLGVDVGQLFAGIGKQRRGCGRRPGLGCAFFS